jgi:hypothetical protein
MYGRASCIGGCDIYEQSTTYSKKTLKVKIVHPTLNFADHPNHSSGPSRVFSARSSDCGSQVYALIVMLHHAILLETSMK